MKFSSLASRNRLYSQLCMKAKQCPLSKLLGWFFLPILSQFLYRCAPVSILLNIQFEPLEISCILSLGSLLLSGTPSCELKQPGLLGFSVSQLGHLQSSAWVPFLCHHLDTLLRQYAGAIVGFTSFVHHLSVITGLCCLMSSVLKNCCLKQLSFVFWYVCLFWQYVKPGQKWKSQIDAF